MKPASAPSIAQQTFFWDRIRGGAYGVVESTWQVFALLIAIRVFNADTAFKQWIPAATGIGLVLSPLTLSLFSQLHNPVARLFAILWLGVAAALLAAAFAPSALLFVIPIILSQVLSSQGTPLLTTLYSQNYPATVRGRRLSTTFIVGSLAGILFGFTGGQLLDIDPRFHTLILLIATAAALLFAFAVNRIPSRPAVQLAASNPFANLATAWRDKVFTLMLTGWMLIGLGNLMMIPLRVEFLANPAYGINASNSQISAILVSTVLAARILSTRIWGFLFDRIHVISLRLLINAVFALSIAIFFFSSNLVGITIGAALLGTAFGGGGIMWMLYVTKVAPPDKVTAYMSVHGFLTGLRMAAAPFIGYAIIQAFHPQTAALLAISLILTSSLIFLPLRKRIPS